MSADPAELMVIDSATGATRVLEGYHPRHNRAHLVCRWPDETAAAFGHRVVKCLGKIGRGAEVATLTLVLGGDPGIARVLPELSRELAAAVAPSGAVQLVGAGASQTEVVRWLASLRDLVEPSVVVDAQFSPSSAPLRAEAS
jgi:hypothetical protein